jgi:membrane carboxypeptidase/penicillin-binding protein
VRLAGGEACLPIWTRHMNRIDGLVADVDWRRPEDVTDREIDPESGMLATPYCPQAKTELFVTGTEPESVCPLHAGSGEPALYWPPPQPQSELRSPMPPQPSPAEMQRRSEAERRRREGSIRRLLRRIFGDN